MKVRAQLASTVFLQSGVRVRIRVGVGLGTSSILSLS